MSHSDQSMKALLSTINGAPYQHLPLFSIEEYGSTWVSSPSTLSYTSSSSACQDSDESPPREKLVSVSFESSLKYRLPETKGRWRKLCNSWERLILHVTCRLSGKEQNQVLGETTWYRAAICACLVR